MVSKHVGTDACDKDQSVKAQDEVSALVGALASGALRVDGLNIPAGIVPDEDAIHAVLTAWAALHCIPDVLSAVFRHCTTLELHTPPPQVLIPSSDSMVHASPSAKR